ncbi:MAG: UDP-N-acetylmuramate dehydrogenase [Opitutaceae bacterium]|nr:UDP-N-acetylmuramate dehydrogenase [Opitutaceae bacterium]
MSTPPQLFGQPIRRLHAVGVGGMGLGPLAIYAAGVGFEVSGGDDAPTEVMVAQLKRAGVRLTEADVLPEDAEMVVASSAVVASHPVLVAARRRGLRVVRRGELLAELASTRRLIAVCGSHGKTTTSAMLYWAMRSAGLSPGYVGGGLFADDALPPAAAGADAWLVAEVDESDGTIAGFSPAITVLVNLDWDHPDHYRTQADLERTFADLLARTTERVLINASCSISALAAQGRQAVVRFGGEGEYRLIGATHSGPARQELAFGGSFPIGKASVRAFGEFNALNATAALAAAHLAGASLRGDLLTDYPGVRRRQALLAYGAGFAVIEDYAHHPAEISALLAGLRLRVPAGGRLRVVFQPHRYSRTAQFRTAFAAALAAADDVYLLDVYGAGEAPLTGGTSEDLADAFRSAHAGVPLVYLPGSHGPVYARLGAELRPGDLVAVVGAGDLDVSARQWLAVMNKTDWWSKIAAYLQARVSIDTKLLQEAPLAPKTTLGVGGAARLYAEPAHETDLYQLVGAAHAIGLRVLPLGRGSNLLVPDEGVDALVLSLRHPFWESFASLGDGRVRVGAGLRLKNLCGLAAKAGLAGFEFLEGIPGNVGGALRMNAGAMGGWMFDVVESVEFITLAGERRTLAKADMHVDYRHCAELENAIATAAILRPASSAPSEDVARQIDTYRDKRKKSQPREPSAGCIFKNPPSDSAGRLIDAAGLKGERVGDAEVSQIHANFIVNHDGARAADVIELVRRVRARVQQAHGIKLEPEVLLYGKDWKDVL